METPETPAAATADVTTTSSTVGITSGTVTIGTGSFTPAVTVTPLPAVSDENVTVVSTPDGGALTVETSSLEDHPIVKEGPLDEGRQLRLEVVLNEAQGDGKPRKVRARVPIAQRGDCLNENRRFYPWEILKADAVKLNERARRGELLMEGEHRSQDGRNKRLILETVAKIGGVVAHDATKTISLEDIQFVGTDAGRNLQAVCEAEIPVYVSQRAEGLAEIRIWTEDKKPYEHIQLLHGDGYDFIPPGTSGVRDARVQLLLEQKRGGGVGTQGDTMETQVVTTPAAETPAVSASAPVATLNEEQVRVIREEIETKLRAEFELKGPRIPDETLTDFQALKGEFEETKKQFNETLQEKARLEQEAKNRVTLNGWVAGEEYKRFNESQKTTLLKHVDVAGTEEEVQARLVAQATMLDEMIAATKLQGMGHTGTPGVVAVVEVNEKFPNYEIITRLNEEVGARLKVDNNGDYAAAGSRARVTKMLLDQFDKHYGQQMYNEAAGVAANLPQVIAYSRVVLEQVMPILSALDLVDTVVMEAVTQVMYQEVWDQPLDAPLDAMMVGENGTAPTVSLRLRPYTMYATDRKLRTSVTPEQLVMAQGIPNYDYLSKNLAGMAKDYARRTDRYIYRFMVAASDMQNFVEVTAFENLTQVGSTKEYKSLHQGWVQWEILKVYNAETNQPVSKLALVGELTGSIHQKVVVRDNVTVLTRGYLRPDGTITVNEDGTGGAAQYYIKYADGSVVLAATPSGTVNAKYTYTLNATFWSQTPASGITFAAHLVNLSKAVGDAETNMQYRYYTPVRQVMSTLVANWIRNSDRFVSSFNTPPNTLNPDNSIGTWAGKAVFTSTNMVDTKILLPTSDAVVRGIAKPWLIEGPLLDTNTGGKSWIGTEFVAEDVTLKDKLTSVTITS